MIDLRTESIDIEDVLVDPNNPRFFDLEDWGEPYPEEMYGEAAVQEEALAKLKRRQLGRIEHLKESIKSNGYIEAELIVVRPYQYAEGDKHLVIEGNRRVAAIKDILGEEPLTQQQEELHDSLSTLTMLVYEPEGETEADKLAEMILQGIRHVSGPREWGAYQKANLVVSLHDDLEHSFDDIDARMGLGPRITPRYYRAFKALEQMKEDEEFGRLAGPHLFTLFEEAIRKPGIREWLEWNRNEYRFENDGRLEAFYNLIAGDPEEDEEPRITNPRQMRQLGDLLAAEKRILVRRFIDGQIEEVGSAYARAFPPDKIPLIDTLESCLEAINELTTDETRNLDEDELDMFDKIVELIERRKLDHRALVNLGE
jgi:hypothetical protein